VPPGVVLVGVRRGDKMTLPRGDTRLEAGDKVFGMGDREGVRRLAERLGGPVVGDGDRSVTIVGGGSVGQMVAEALEGAGGFDLRVIEADEERAQELAKTLPKTLVLHGDGTDIDLLEGEDVRSSRVLVAVTNRDEKNLLVSLLGKQLGVKRIVTRADSTANERLFERVGIDVVRSAKGTAIQAVVAEFGGERSRLLAEVEHGDARVLELEVPGGTAPVQLKHLHAPVYAIVGAVIREGRTTIPRGEDEIRSGDRIVVFCDAASEEAARAYFAHGPRAG
jgi:trk system potassium uptake protein TrkA